MKILGHAYVATRAIKGNNQLLIIGSLLPEMLPYIPNNIFGYEELHEGGKKLLAYLERSCPEKKDLGLGLLSHGAQLGADKYSRESEKLVAPKREYLIKKISQAHRVDLKVAEGRVHNYVGLGIDWLLVQNEPELIKTVQETIKKIRLEEIAYLMAEAFGKDKTGVKKMLETLFKRIYCDKDLTSEEGLARIWARQAEGLPEKDEVDISQSARIIIECADLLKGEWKSFLRSVVLGVSNELKLLAVFGEAG